MAQTPFERVRKTPSSASPEPFPFVSRAVVEALEKRFPDTLAGTDSSNLQHKKGIQFLLNYLRTKMKQQEEKPQH